MSAAGTVYRRLSTRVAMGVLVWACVAGMAWAQAIGNSDIQRLQDALFDASRDVASVRVSDSARAAQLDRELDDARDDVAYLRVLLRRNATVPVDDFNSVRDRIDAIRSRARNVSLATPAATAPSAVPAAQVPAPTQPASSAPVPVARPANCGPRDVCVGQELDVRVQVPLSSNTANVEDRFEATTLVPFYNENNELIPAGSLMRGVVASVDRAGRIDRKGRLTLSFDEMIVRGKSYKIRATVTDTIESAGMRGEASKIGAGAGVGAIIGGILGGVKGAITGILIGGGGVMAATEGKDVEIPAGTVLRVRFDSPVTVTTAR